jgi:hypothetical protein
VLVYQTAALETDIEILGEVWLELFMTSDRLDTDVSVRLCDAFPDGRLLLMAGGIRRARFRNGYESESLLTSGETFSISVRLQNLGLTLKPGHRLAVLVSSSDYPRFDVNPNSGGPLYQAGDTLVAENRILTGPIHASRVLLPVRRERTGVPIRSETRPESMRLLPVYPNPFNGRARISFFLPSGAHVLLRILDATGRLARVLLDAGLAAGWHALNVDAADLPSGVYICVMEAGPKVLTRKMLVSK